MKLNDITKIHKERQREVIQTHREEGSERCSFKLRYADTAQS
jgi:3-methyladenine DNA glycosylase AlkC